MKTLSKPSLIRGMFIILGVGLMIFGAFRGELTELMKKAVTVCLECIGIG
jgi:hypothetical protein